MPALGLTRELVDEDQRDALSDLLVVEADAVDGDSWHGSSPVAARGVNRARRARIAFLERPASRATPARRLADVSAGKRASSAGSAICPSIRASAAPRQKWMPWPNARWRLSVRSRSSLVRLLELARVPVGGIDHQEDAIAAPDHAAVDRHVLAGHPHHCLAGAIVAEQFLHGGRRERGILPPGSRLGRVAEQCESAVADEVRRRLVAGEEEQHAVRHEFVLAQRLSSSLIR